MMGGAARRCPVGNLKEISKLPERLHDRPRDRALRVRTVPSRCHGGGPAAGRPTRRALAEGLRDVADAGPASWAVGLAAGPGSRDLAGYVRRRGEPDPE